MVETLTCPHCLARLRLTAGLQPGADVACPRCQTQFAIPTKTMQGSSVPESRTHVFDRERSPNRGSHQPAYRPEPDEDYPTPSRQSHHGVTLHLQIVCVLQGLTLLGALIVAVAAIHSIVISGPLISLLGIYISVLCLLRRFWLGVVVGLSAPMFSLFIFLLINVLSWGPMVAHVPVCVMGLAYVAVVVPFLACVCVFPLLFYPAKEDEADQYRDSARLGR